MFNFRPVFLCSLLLLLCTCVRAQTTAAPVTAALQSRPPFTPNLGDWTNPVNNPLQATLLLNDRTRNGYQVRLGVSIIGQGIELRTKPEFQPTPVALTFGMPETLGSAELREYFNVNNLNFVGYSLQAYVDNGGLPPGTYQVCVEAYDYERSDQEAVSLPACTFLQARLLDPPVVISPLGETSPVNPQQLIVQWQARHTATFVTDYRVEIYSVDPASGLTAEQIYAQQQPYVEAELSGMTSINIDASFPTLEAGAYLIRVRASDMMNPTGVFKNGGWSSPAFFEYGGLCEAPGGLAADVSSSSEAAVSFAPVAGAANYVLRYRAATPGANWYEESSLTTAIDLSELIDTTRYEVQVQTVCNGVGGEFSPTYEFTTLAEPFVDSDIACGDEVDDLPTITNTEAIGSLTPGQVIRVGQFDMVLVAVGPAGDGFVGRGQISVPWLGTRFNARFNRLMVNTDRQVYDGNVIVVDEGLENIPGYRSVDEILEDRETDAVGNFCGLPPVSRDSIIADSLRWVVRDSIYRDSLNYMVDTLNSRANDYFYGGLNPAEGFDPAEDIWNPENTDRPYDPADSTDRHNPYRASAGKPYRPDDIWNPYNQFNPYNKMDYSDPANPYTELRPWTVERMFNSIEDDEPLIGAGFTGGTNLPVLVGSGENAIAVHTMVFTPTSASVSAYAAALIPGLNQYVAFGAEGLTFNPAGVQGSNKITMLTPLTTIVGKSRLSVARGGNTYLAFDCNGVTGVSLDVRLELCPDVARPLKAYSFDTIQRGLGEPTYVTADFQITAQSVRDLTAEFSVTPFEHPSLPGWAFSVTSCVIDLSEDSTPESVTFPEDYSHPAVSGTDGEGSPAWTGLYIAEGRVTMPDGLFSRSPAGRDSLAPPPPDTVARNTINRTIGVENMLVDETGFTSGIYATNLFPLSEGSAGGWPISLDSVAVRIESNTLREAALGGSIRVPAFAGDFAYTASFTSEQVYTFVVDVQDSVEMTAFGADVKLRENCAILLEYDRQEKKFFAEATLHGEATFRPGTSPPPGGNQPPRERSAFMKIPKISFADFKVKTVAPYIENIGSWSLSNESEDKPKVNDFPITLHEVGMFHNKEKEEVAFGMDLSVNLVKPGDNGFGARGRGYIVCDVKIDSTGRQDWKFNRVRLDRLQVDYASPAYKLQGFIENYEDHPVYGTGFTGAINAEFKPSLAVGAAAMFGKVDDYRYFFVDANVQFQPGIVLGASGLAVYGFGGGLAYRMERQDFESISIDLPMSTAQEAGELAESSNNTGNDQGGQGQGGQGQGGQGQGGQGQGQPPVEHGNLEDNFNRDDPSSSYPEPVAMPTELGQSMSGVSYVPNRDKFLELKASVDFGALQRNTFNGRLEFYIQFNDNAGVDKLGLLGNVNFMTAPPVTKSYAEKGMVSALMDMNYDFENDAFSAYLRAEINLQGGLIRGAYPGNVAGEGIIYADNSDWYVYLGTPQSPILMGYDLSFLNNLIDPRDSPTTAQDSLDHFQQDSTNYANLIDSLSQGQGPLGSPQVFGLQIGGYFDMGTILPDFPPVPREVTEILGQDYSMTDRNDPAFATGGGVMLGASARVATPELKFLIFYGQINGGIGLDLMMRDYGSASCAGGDGGAVGIDGWYATGQAWAFLDARIGIRVKLGLLDVDAEILSLQAAAVLQAEFPNPWYMRGAVGGRYEVLGGAISGRCNFEFEMGKRCIMTNADENILVINDLTPEGTEQSVFSKPRATFNIGMNREYTFRAKDLKRYTLKPSVTKYQVKNMETGQVLAGTVSYSEDGLIGVWKPRDIMQGNTTHEVTVSVKVQQKLAGSNNPWMDVDLTGGQAGTVQTKTIYFTTGPAPEVIVPDNVVYTYPVRDQLNFFVDESLQSYVQLDIGQPALFLGQPGNELSPADWVQQARFWQADEIVGTADIAYNPASKRVNLALPAGALDLNTVTRLEIANVPIRVIDSINAATELATRGLDIDLPDGSPVTEADLGEINIRENRQTGSLEELRVKTLYELHFRTSNHRTFAAKVAALGAEEQYNLLEALTTPSDTIFFEDGRFMTGPYLSMFSFGGRRPATEAFDVYDVWGETVADGAWRVDPLVRPVADLNDTERGWWQTYPQDNFYDLIDQLPPGYALTWRSDTTLGGPVPDRAIRVNNDGVPYNLRLMPQQYQNTEFYPQPSVLDLTYRLPVVAYRDYADYWNQVNSYLTYRDPNPAERSIHDWDFIYAPTGDFGLYLEYYLPGAQEPSSRVKTYLRYVIDTQSR